MADQEELEARLAELEATIALEAEDPDARAELLKALVERADTLGDLCRFEEADTAYGKLIEAFGGPDDDDPVIERSLATGLFNRAIVRRDSGSFEGALAAAEDFLNRFGGDPPAGRADTVIRCLNLKATLLWRLGRIDESIAVFEATFARYRDDDDAKIRERLAAMIFAEGRLAKRAGRFELALDAYTELLETFGEAEDTPTLKTLTNATFEKGVVLGELGRDSEALVLWSAIWERYRDETDAPFRRFAFASHFNEAIVLRRLGREEEAALACDELVERYSEDDSSRVLEIVADAIQVRLTLADKSEGPAGLAVIERLLELIRRSESDAIGDQLFFALSVRVRKLLDGLDWREAVSTSDELIGLFERETDPRRLYERGRWLLLSAGALTRHPRLRARFRPPTMIAIRLADSADRLPRASAWMAHHARRGRLAATVDAMRRTRDQELRIESVIVERLSGEEDPRLRKLAARAQVQSIAAWAGSLHPLRGGKIVSSLLESGPAAAAALELQRQDVEKHQPGSPQAALATFARALLIDDTGGDGPDPYADLISNYGRVRSPRVQLVVLAARLSRLFIR